MILVLSIHFLRSLGICYCAGQQNFKHLIMLSTTLTLPLQKEQRFCLACLPTNPRQLQRVGKSSYGTVAQEAQGHWSHSVTSHISTRPVIHTDNQSTTAASPRALFLFFSSKYCVITLCFSILVVSIFKDDDDAAITPCVAGVPPHYFGEFPVWAPIRGWWQTRPEWKYWGT